MAQLPPIAKTQIKDPVTVQFEYLVSIGQGNAQRTALGTYEATQWETTRDVREGVLADACKQMGLDIHRAKLTVLFMDFRRNVPVNEM